MRWYKISGISKRIILTIIRDYKFLFLAIAAPIILLMVFSVTYKPEIEQITLGILNLDSNSLQQINVAESIKNYLKKNIHNLKLIEYNSFDTAKNDFENNRIDAVVVFPEKINETVFIKISGVPVENPAEISLYLDETNKLVSSIISAGLETSIVQFSQSLGIEPAVIFSKQSFYKNHATSENFWVAGIIGFSIFVLSLLFSTSLITSEKSSGTLESIVSSSMSSFEILMGYFIGYLFINVIQIIILLFAYILFFKGILSTSIIIIFIIMLLLSISGSLLGILLSFAFSSTIRSFQIAIIIMLVSLLISGIFWPTSSLPFTGKILSYLLPSSFAIEAIRYIIIKNLDFIKILPYILIISCFCILYFVLALVFVRKSVN